MKKILISLLCIMVIFACTKPQPKLTAEESMSKGLTYFKKKKYDQAIPFFENSIMEATDPEMAAKAQLFLADSYFLDKKYPEAIPAYQQYLEIYSESEDANLALYRMGMSHYALIDKMDRDMSAAEGSLKAFTQLREKDPAFSREYELTKKIVELRAMLAERELYVAKFYIRIKEPKAGVKRLENLMLNYKDTPSYEDALFIYAGHLKTQPGKEAEAIKFYNLLIKDVPNTKYVKEVAKDLAELLAKVTADLDKKQKEGK